MSESNPMVDIISAARAVYQVATHVEGMSNDIKLGVLNGMRLSIVETLVTQVLRGAGYSDEAVALSEWQEFAHDEERRILEERLSESSR